MSVAVKAPARNLPALAVSLLLHGSLVLLPVLAGALGKAPLPLPLLPNNVALEGSSIEIDAPSPELADTPSQPGGEPEEAIAVEPESLPAAAAEAEPQASPTPRPSESRPRPSKPPTPAVSGSARAETTAGATPSPSGEAGPSTPGSFGSERLAPGVKRVGYAFAHAIPPATRNDPAWKELPAGVVGIIRVQIEVGENNQIDGVQTLPPRRGEPPTPPALERLVQRTIPFLRMGQFALSGSNQPGKELLSVEVLLLDGPADEDPKGEVAQLGFVPVTPGHPGGATFRYDTGRQFKATVTIVPATN